MASLALQSNVASDMTFFYQKDFKIVRFRFHLSILVVICLVEWSECRFYDHFEQKILIQFSVKLRCCAFG